MAGYWTFKDYVGDDDENAILAWLDALPKGAKVKINAFITRQEVTATLGMPAVKKLKGTCVGLMELRIPAQNVQYRPLCCYGPGEREVTILFGAIEKGGKFEPLSACSTALMRKARIGERERTRDHDFS